MKRILPLSNSTFCALSFIITINLSLILGFDNAYAANDNSKSGIGQISQQINVLKQQNVFQQETKVFSVAQSKPSVNTAATVSKFTTLNLEAGISTVLTTKPDNLKLNIPIENGSRVLTLLLYKVNISQNGFTLITSSGTTPSLGNIVNYRGTIDNDQYSVVSMTFTDDETMGLISNSEGNYVVGKIKNDAQNLYMVYNDKDMIAKPVMSCGSNGLPPANANRGNQVNTTMTTKCVNMYWETDYDLFTDKGSVANVTAYMQAVFNQVSTLYANDGISITLKTLFVWDTTDPYTGTDANSYLSQFVTYRTSFDGDLAHLIGYQGSGGVAYVGVLCSSQSHQKGYSGIYSSYSNVPTFSWTVEVLTHEMGHEMGSPHTHACSWNGNNTKIDDCGGSAGYSEGTCPPDPSPLLPVAGGTIMSYCHLTSAGINFSLGFGPQPKALIISNINSASCLTTCGCTIASQPGTISGSASVCSGSALTYSVASVSGATSYTWNLPSGWTGTSTTNSITVTSGSSGGSISVTANNSCGSSAAQSKSITMTSVTQPGTISGSASVCSGSSLTYSVASVSGATSYTWNLPSGWTGTSTTNSIIVTSGSSGGSISVTANNSCGSSAAQSKSVTMTSVTQPGTISGSASVCSGSSLTYSVASVSGATSYTWNLPSGWTGTSTTNSITVTSGSSGGSISVTANNSCGSSAAQSKSVTMTSVTQPGTISGSASVCSGSSLTYSVASVSGATSYTWNLPSGWTGTSTTNSITVTSGSSGGSISVTANNSCGSSAAQSKSISMTSVTQPGTISGSASVCSGSSLTYSVASVSGATSYTWNLPSGWTGTSTTNSITVTSGSSGGSISVTANNSCGSSASQILSVSISSVVAQTASIAGNTSACGSSSQTYSVAAVSGAVSYTWALPSGWTGTSTTNTITLTAGSSSGTISVIANNACGSSIARTLAVTVPVIPTKPAAIAGTPSTCPSSTLTYSVATVSGATSYIWTLPSGWTGTSSTNTISLTAGSSSGTLSVRAWNTCGGSASRTMALTVNASSPAQPSAIAGNTLVCDASSQTYSVSPVAGAISYNWTLPSGWTGFSTVNSITVTTGSSPGTILVTASNSCGTGAAQTLPVTVSAIPSKPGSINGATSVCEGASQAYSVAPVSGATSYTWTMPSGWSGTSSTNVITVLSGNTGGSISVIANGTCGNSSAQTLSVAASSIPSTPVSITGSASVCSGTSEVYSVSLVSGAMNYTWALPSGWTGSSTTNVITAVTGTTNGNVSVIAGNACGSSAAQTLAVTSASVPAKPGTIKGTAAVCQGSSQTYSVTAVAGVSSYTWTLPSGWTGTSTTNTINVVSGSANGNISVKANNTCGISATRTLAVTTVVSTLAQPVAVKGASLVMAQSVQTYSVAPVAGATSYTWSLPPGWTGTSTTETITVTVGDSSGLVTVMANNTCASSAVQSLSVQVDVSTSVPGNMHDNSSSAFNVFPNPAHNVVTISLGSSTNAWVEIHDLPGSLVYRQKHIASGEKHALQIPLHVVAGIYLVQVNDGAHQYVQKLVVE